MAFLRNVMLLVLGVRSCAGSANLGRGSLRASLNASSLQSDLKSAMGEIMGCGGNADEKHLQELEASLTRLWQTLPKNSGGNVDRQMLRYVVYRHFQAEWGMVLRGFEPSSSNGSLAADILMQQAPAVVENVLESRHAAKGFTLADAAYMIATLEQLVFDAEGSQLTAVYDARAQRPEELLHDFDLHRILEDYMLRWMIGSDPETLRVLMADVHLKRRSVPHWSEVEFLVQGEVRQLQHQREQLPLQQKDTAGGNALSPRYSFQDAHAVVGSITKNFASFWDSECRSMKARLASMDRHGTGRVPLSKFYSSALSSEWRFGESESYLRSMGVLDETSWLGKQVIIPNYLQAASNCIVSAPHYMVCCESGCGSIMSEIEAAVGAPVAEPAFLLELVGNITAVTSDLVEQSPKLEGSLAKQLESIAETHGGVVPIYSRLFAQWLHYAFPQDCPFPHKSGSVANGLTPSSFGEGYLASELDMKAHAVHEATADALANSSKEELQWMSQWSAEEELIGDYGAHLGSGWGRRSLMAWALFGAASCFGVLRLGKKENMLLPLAGGKKEHCF